MIIDTPKITETDPKRKVDQIVSYLFQLATQLQMGFDQLESERKEHDDGV